MSDFAEFKRQRDASVAALKAQDDLRRRAFELVRDAGRLGYQYNFDWLGLPIIQLPQDIMAVQELIWRVKPGAIVETGVARGGSLLLSASLLELIGGDGIVIGVEIEMRAHNRKAIEDHPLAHRIRIVEGSSVERTTLAKVEAALAGKRPVMLLLDSHHTHEHVLAELRLYTPLVGAGSYAIVFDTFVEDLPSGYYANRPWGPGNSPKTAVRAFLAECGRFEIDRDIEAKLLLTSNPEGYLRCTKDA
jgi:cephalosporin hydroxylase